MNDGLPIIQHDYGFIYQLDLGPLPCLEPLTLFGVSVPDLKNADGTRWLFSV